MQRQAIQVQKLYGVKGSAEVELVKMLNGMTNDWEAYEKEMKILCVVTDGGFRGKDRA